MLETRDQQQVYVKFLVMGHSIRQLQNMLGTLRTLHQLAREEELDLLRKLDYIGLRAKDVPLLNKLDKLNDRINYIGMLMSLTSEAMIKKVSG